MLLDTQLALWSITDDPKLGVRARSFMDGADRVWVSVVSIWEIAIKYPLQRGGGNDMPIPGSVAHRLFLEAGFTILPISAAHAVAVDDLPPLHGDPFDRMLVAQALTEPLRLLTRDVRLADYGALVTVA